MYMASENSHTPTLHCSAAGAQCCPVRPIAREREILKIKFFLLLNLQRAYMNNRLNNLRHCGEDGLSAWAHINIKLFKVNIK
jgi:hypothetical protein